MMQPRWILRDGEWVLQFRHAKIHIYKVNGVCQKTHIEWLDWEDVPIGWEGE